MSMMVKYLKPLYVDGSAATAFASVLASDKRGATFGGCMRNAEGKITARFRARFAFLSDADEDKLLGEKAMVGVRRAVQAASAL